MITTIGTANGYVATQTAAALVTAGVVTVLVLPAIAMRLLPRDYPAHLDIDVTDTDAL